MENVIEYLSGEGFTKKGARHFVRELDFFGHIVKVAVWMTASENAVAQGAKWASKADMLVRLGTRYRPVKLTDVFFAEDAQKALEAIMEDRVLREMMESQGVTIKE